MRHSNKFYGDTIMWTQPEYSDMRFGFEVTMYICNR
ncbi:MAG: pyrroloquinoline quinone precursor peptide PqqA [Methylophaga sp.]|nr:MAG: pyrroloquinoline quinone precursor peptide PqqA [Methylophaga sp.]